MILWIELEMERTKKLSTIGVYVSSVIAGMPHSSTLIFLSGYIAENVYCYV